MIYPYTVRTVGAVGDLAPVLNNIEKTHDVITIFPAAGEIVVVAKEREGAAQA